MSSFKKTSNISNVARYSSHVWLTFKLNVGKHIFMSSNQPTLKKIFVWFTFIHLRIQFSSFYCIKDFCLCYWFLLSANDYSHHYKFLAENFDWTTVSHPIKCHQAYIKHTVLFADTNILQARSSLCHLQGEKSGEMENVVLNITTKHHCNKTIDMCIQVFACTCVCVCIYTYHNLLVSL